MGCNNRGPGMERTSPSSVELADSAFRLDRSIEQTTADHSYPESRCNLFAVKAASLLSRKMFLVAALSVKVLASTLQGARLTIGHTIAKPATLPLAHKTLYDCV